MKNTIFFLLLIALTCASPRVEAQNTDELREQNLTVYPEGDEPEVPDDDSIIATMKGRTLVDGYKFCDSIWNLIEFIPQHAFDYDVKVKFYPNRDRRTATAYFVLKAGGLLEVKGFNLQGFLSERKSEIANTDRLYDYGRSYPEMLEPDELPRKGSVRYADMFEHGDPMIFHVKGPSPQGNRDTQMWFSIMVPEQVAHQIEEQYQDMCDKAPDGEPTRAMLDNFTVSINYLVVQFM